MRGGEGTGYAALAFALLPALKMTENQALRCYRMVSGASSRCIIHYLALANFLLLSKGTDVHEKPLLGVPEMTLHVREMTLQILICFLVGRI